MLKEQIVGSLKKNEVEHEDFKIGVWTFSGKQR